MTAKEKFTQWTMKGAERSQDPKNTFIHRITVKVLSSLILSAIGVTIYFIIDVRDNMKKIPTQENDIKILKKQQQASSQKFNLILLNDGNRGVTSNNLYPIFQELDRAAIKPETE